MSILIPKETNIIASKSKKKKKKMAKIWKLDVKKIYPNYQNII